MSDGIPMKQNCWEYKKCGREPGGAKADEICECTAAVIGTLRDGKQNGGTRGGRRCWRVAGTLCGGEPQGVYAKKIGNCRLCDFYLKVKEEEGDDFVE